MKGLSVLQPCLCTRSSNSGIPVSGVSREEVHKKAATTASERRTSGNVYTLILYFLTCINFSLSLCIHDQSVAAHRPEGQCDCLATLAVINKGTTITEMKMN